MWWPCGGIPQYSAVREYSCVYFVGFNWKCKKLYFLTQNKHCHTCIITIPAIGPGCPDIEVHSHATVKYEMTNLELFANITCDRGYYFTGTELSVKRVQCVGLYWSDIEISCIGECIFLNFYCAKFRISFLSYSIMSCNTSKCHWTWRGITNTLNRLGDVYFI